MNWLLWIGLIVATWRGCRLIIKDSFPPSVALRGWVIGTFGRVSTDVESHNYGELIGGREGWGIFGYSLAYIFTCPWCMSIYMAAALWGIAVWCGFSVPLPWLLIAAASGFTGLLQSLENRLDLSYDEADRRLRR